MFYKKTEYISKYSVALNSCCKHIFNTQEYTALKEIMNTLTAQKARPCPKAF